MSYVDRALADMRNDLHNIQIFFRDTFHHFR